MATTTFGNTLSELQAGTNADKGLDYQRANAQDALNQQRLEAFLRLRGQQLETQARQSETAAARAQRMAEFLQQNKQFETSETNAMKRAELEAQTRRDVAKTTAEGRANPQLEGLKLELQQEEAERKSLSDARRKIVEEMKVLEQAQRKNYWSDWGDPNDIGSRWTSKRYGELREALSKLDSIAAPLRLSPSPYGGYAGYDVAPPTIPTQPVTPPPATVSPTQPMIPFMGMGGYVPPANRVVAPAPVPPMLQTPVSGRGTNYFDFSNGALVPR